MPPSIVLLLAAFPAYIAISAVWNIFFHRLMHIPGPKTWIAFRLLRYIAGARGVFDIEVRRLHKEYGNVVRLSDDGVSFIAEPAWKEIYGHGHKQLPKHLFSGANKLDIISSDDVNHSRYRKALSHAFSAKGLQVQEPLLACYVDKFIQRLDGFAESGLPADMVKWYNLTTFDLIGDLAFGQPFGGLDSSEYHHWVATIFNSFKVLPLVRMKDAYPWLLNPLFALMPKSMMEARMKQREHASVTVQKRLHDTSAHGRGDFMDSMLRHRGQKDGLTDQELEANANILIIAGSETTATLLSEALAAVTSEVRSVIQSEEDISFFNVSSQLPYLIACIDEAFRRYPPVPSGLPRISQEPMQVSGYTIPSQTKVSVHQSAAYWSTENFHDPDRYAPERWLPGAREDPNSPYYHDNRDIVQPFSVGPRNCLGKNVAYAEMRIILARVLWNFDMALCEESRHWRDQKTYILWEKPALWIEGLHQASDPSVTSGVGILTSQYILPEKYIDSLRKGPANDVPFITGNNKDESGAALSTNYTAAEYKTYCTLKYGNLSQEYFTLYPGRNTSEASHAWNAAARDTSPVSSWAFARDWAKSASSPFYTYYWDHAPPSQSQGAYHASELYYALDSLYASSNDHAWTWYDYHVAEIMSSYWVNFAKTGNPNLGGTYPFDNLTHWEPVDGESRTVFHVGEGFGDVPLAKPGQVDLILKYFAQQTPY